MSVLLSCPHLLYFAEYLDIRVMDVCSSCSCTDTWGDPMYRGLYPPNERVAPKSSNHVILGPDENGQDETSLEITENLARALIGLANLGYCTAAETGSPAYIWIDALCIDQTNNDEKGVQVAMMDEIYKNASKVVIFLGDADQHTECALEVMEELAKVPEKNPNWASHSFDDFDAATAFANLLEASRTLGMRDLSPADWLDYGAFLMRNWFGRIWVVQERYFAAETAMFIGGTEIEWAKLTRASKVLFNTRMNHSLEAQILFAIHGTDLYQDDSVAELFGDRLKNEHIFETLNRGSGFPTGLETLLYYSKCFDATEPRDHFFGVLGIWKEVQSESVAAAAVRPDYHASVAEVYAQATMFAVKERGDLGILAMVEDHSLAKPIKSFLGDHTESELPSWIPDYSHRPHTRPLALWPREGPNFQIPRRWNASQGLTYHFSDCINASGKLMLPIKGIEVDRIGGIGPTYREISKRYELLGLLRLLEDVAAANSHPDPDDASLYEAFCRTLIKDTWIDEPPGERTRSVLPYILQYRLSFMRWRIDDLKEAAEDSKLRKLDDEVILFEAEARRHTETLKETERIVRELTAKLPGMCTWEEVLELEEQQNEVDNDDDEEHEGEPLEGEHEESIPIDRISQDLESSFWTAHSGRRAFRTTNGRFGLSGLSLRTGDVVWVIAGVETPLVLRPCGWAEWQLVGEAYVDGIMNGEAVSQGDMHLRQIWLV